MIDNQIRGLAETIGPAVSIPYHGDFCSINNRYTIDEPFNIGAGVRWWAQDDQQGTVSNVIPKLPGIPALTMRMITVSFINGKYTLPGDGVHCPW